MGFLGHQILIKYDRRRIAGPVIIDGVVIFCLR